MKHILSGILVVAAAVCLTPAPEFLGQSMTPRPIPSDVESADTTFIQLMQRAQGLDSQIREWNENCHPITEENVKPCIIVKGIIDKELQSFVDDTADYKSKGTGCSSTLEGPVLNHLRALYTWNIECVKPNAPEQCAEREKTLEADQKTLHQKIKDCVEEATKL